MFFATVKVYTRQVLFEHGPIDAFQAVLVERSPTWCADVWFVRYERRAEKVDLEDPTALYRIACREADKNPLGLVYLRGRRRTLNLYLHLDHRPIGPWTYGNSLAVQIERKTVEGIPYSIWSLDLLLDLSANPTIGVDYGTSRLDPEWESKNVDRARGGWRGVGPSNLALPGIYWANYLGPPYCDLIGRDRLLSAPAHEVREVGAGVLVIMGENPEDWNTPEYKEREQRFLDHVGREYFFERGNPDKPTVSPFDLPPLPPHDPSKDIHVLHQGGGKFKVLSPEERRSMARRSNGK